MRARSSLLGSVSAVVLASWYGCTIEDMDPPPPNRDGGLALDGSTSPDSSTANGDATPAAETGSVAPTSDASDVQVDVGSDVTPGTAIVLFAHANQTLYRIDPDTAAMTMVGATGQSDARMVWDETAGVMRAIVDALTGPKIATIDLCTGVITVGPQLTKLDDAGPLARAECIARHPNGTFYGGADWNGDSSGTPRSESLVRYDVAAGTAERIAGPVDTTQGDCDSATFVGTALYMLDPAQPITSGVHRINLTNASGTEIGKPPLEVIRFSWDQSRGTFFAYGESQKLYRLSLQDAGATVVGDLALGSGIVDSLVPVPAPICP